MDHVSPGVYMMRNTMVGEGGDVRKWFKIGKDKIENGIKKGINLVKNSKDFSSTTWGEEGGGEQINYNAQYILLQFGQLQMTLIPYCLKSFT